ncbi:hypothetical protein CTAYLR_005625 [Chrysophaeum taylorii]|uniref:Uncharacterized protein n=1 Tax=Chrysophaeum taylorii TaxID=2483200 RepID=A0AAD7XHT9_9STRA|nr:hypothetical protein CTAYLR_005625 [Chrysophaeum taylorii]
MTFGSFLWCHYFVLPNVALGALVGYVRLRVREHLSRCCLGEAEARELVARFILNQISLAVHLTTLEDSIAVFHFRDLAMLDGKGNCKVASLLRVEVDAKNRVMINACLDDRELTPSESYILLWFYTVTSAHGRIHAAAGWGHDVDSLDLIVRRNAICSIFYNFLGYTRFGQFAGLLHRLGILKHQFARVALVFDHGLRQGFPVHANIALLAPYSKFVDFVLKLRPIFIANFRRMTSDTTRMDPEGHFIASIIHGLDHANATSLVDPLHLDVHHPDFGAMAECGRYIRACYVADIPALLFPVNYSQFQGKAKYQPSDVLKAVLGRRLTEEYDSGQLKAKYGDCFIRGNNGAPSPIP